MADREPSAALLAGRRALEGLAGFTLLRDWEWSEVANAWTLHCRLASALPVAGIVPATTHWYVLVADTYPRGRLKFYPAKQGGLTHTFPHQNYNDTGDTNTAWRSGDLCLDTSTHLLGRQRVDREPRETHRRLRWHVERAQAWLVAAASGTLLADGDPFELPQHPLAHRKTFVAFSEGPTHFKDWQAIPERCGLVNLALLREGPDGYVVRSFCSPGHQLLFVPNWGTMLSGTFEREEWGIWLRLDGVPILDPWQAPITWAELRTACAMGGTNVDALLRPVLKRIRDGRKHLALVGYPIPAVVGEEPVQMHWQAMELPVLSSRQEVLSGFRTNEVGYWDRDRRKVLKGDVSLDWIDSQNWHADQLATRGRLPDDLACRRIAILGAGAVGSVLATLLVRAGVDNLVLIDRDRLQAGNLVRHTLGVAQVGEDKAVALASQLNATSPHARVIAVTARFPDLSLAESELLQTCDLVIDCTAEDDVLDALREFAWDGERIFCSLSLGFEARRLFCFLARASSFPTDEFERLMTPWFAKGTAEFDDTRLPWEGVGCWHPVFPARIDQVWLLVSAIVGVLAAPGQMCDLDAPELIVLEQRAGGAGIAGIDVVRDASAA